MTFLKNIIKALYNRFVSVEERQADAMLQLPKDKIGELAITYFKIEVPRMKLFDKRYKDAYQAAESVVLFDNNTTSFSKMCRDFVRKSSSDDFYLISTLDNLVASVDGFPAQPGNEGSLLMTLITGDVELAKHEKSFIKRRSIIRNAIKTQVPGLNADQLNLAVELVLAMK